MFSVETEPHFLSLSHFRLQAGIGKTKISTFSTLELGGGVPEMAQHKRRLAPRLRRRCSKGHTQNLQDFRFSSSKKSLPRCAGLTKGGTGRAVPYRYQKSLLTSSG